MRIALAQITSGTDLEHNAVQMRARIAEAAARGAELVCFPEYSMYEKKTVDASFGGVAEPLDGPFVTRLAELADAHGVAVVAGVVERHPDGANPYNTLVALDGRGAIVGRYRKRYLYDAYGFRESTWISRPEHETVVVRLAGTRIGLMTCSDLRHPGFATELSAAGATVILECASWVPGPSKVEHWRVLTRARAIENLCFVAGVSQCPPVSIGRSLVVDPMGELLAELSDKPGLLVVDLDLEQVTRQRATAAS